MGELALKRYAPPGSRLLTEAQYTEWTTQLCEAEHSHELQGWAVAENKCLQSILSNHDAEIARLQPVELCPVA